MANIKQAISQAWSSFQSLVKSAILKASSPPNLEKYFKAYVRSKTSSQLVSKQKQSMVGSINLPSSGPMSKSTSSFIFSSGHQNELNSWSNCFLALKVSDFGSIVLNYSIEYPIVRLGQSKLFILCGQFLNSQIINAWMQTRNQLTSMYLFLSESQIQKQSYVQRLFSRLQLPLGQRPACLLIFQATIQFIYGSASLPSEL